MSSTSNLMQLGCAPDLARHILGVVQTGLQAATGTTQTDAYQLYAFGTAFGTVATGTGARLPSVESPLTMMVSNLGANALLVYPATGQTINGGAVNASISLPAGKTAQFWGISSTGWVAQAGA